MKIAVICQYLFPSVSKCHAVNEVDIIACLSTGYGKSFCMKYVEAEFRKKLTSGVLVVSLLNAIIDNHVSRLGNRGKSRSGECTAFRQSQVLFETSRKHIGQRYAHWLANSVTSHGLDCY